ncbi:hypothetical protein H5410_061230 [Solanum commersonii]|uniref:Uncharacterized protein n=1 Tax=Solanum commersonii TaxID=4109 RepID=A0A9J5W8I7_SOLCO|nr:hypothetical protein H5410_061230 [Solanum commersonii]
MQISTIYRPYQFSSPHDDENGTRKMECTDKQDTKIIAFVHKEVELAFTDNTVIKATDIEVSIHRFSIGFVSLDHVDKLPNRAILVSTNPLIEKEYSKRQEIVLTNEQYKMTVLF